MDIIQKHKKSIIHFLKFMVVGAINFGVDAGIGSLLNGVLGVPLVIANTISYSCGVINSYVLNMFWTFKIRYKFFSPYTINPGRKFEKGLKIWFFSVPFLQFIFVNLISLGVNDLSMNILVTGYGLPYIEGKILATVFSFVVNFAGSKLLVFREKKNPVIEENKETLSEQEDKQDKE